MPGEKKIYETVDELRTTTSVRILRTWFGESTHDESQSPRTSSYWSRESRKHFWE